MNSCHAIKKNAQSYLLDELSPEERRGFQLHLKDCSSCRDFLSAYIDFDTLLFAEGKRGEEFDERLMKEAREIRATRLKSVSEEPVQSTCSHARLTIEKLQLVRESVKELTESVCRSFFQERYPKLLGFHSQLFSAIYDAAGHEDYVDQIRGVAFAQHDLSEMTVGKAIPIFRGLLEAVVEAIDAEESIERKREKVTELLSEVEEPHTKEFADFLSQVIQDVK